MDLKQYWELLNKHDWYYNFSDDSRAYRKGYEADTELRSYKSESPAHAKLFEDFHTHNFSGKPWDTEQKPKPKKPE